MEMKFSSKAVTIFSINSVYSPPKFTVADDFYQTNKSFSLRIEELTKETEKLTQEINHLNSKLYIAENRFNDKEKDHEKIVKDKNSEIEKLKKKSWASKSAPFLACTLSLILIFVVLRIYFTLYPLHDTTNVN